MADQGDINLHQVNSDKVETNSQLELPLTNDVATETTEPSTQRNASSSQTTGVKNSPQINLFAKLFKPSKLTFK